MNESKKGKRIVGLCLVVCGVMVNSALCLAATTGLAKKTVTAQGAYAVDYTNRRVLYAKNTRTKLYPASTVKLLTALVVRAHKDLKEKIRVSAKAVNVEPTRVGLVRGVSYCVEDLLEALVATSANDAGVALAEAVAGSEGQFAVLMNQKARQLGMKNSHFTNATGLPDKSQVTTAYDMAILTRAAFSDPFIKKAMAKKTITIRGSNGVVIKKRNHNKLLWRLDYPQALGKTGYTRAARHCFAGIAYYGDRRVSFVILKSAKPWDDIYAMLGVSPKKVKK